MNELKNKVIQFNSNNIEIMNNIPDLIDDKSLNIIHHIWRVVLQCGNKYIISKICRLIIDMQKSTGNWGVGKENVNYGDTVVNIHRLLWSLSVGAEGDEIRDMIVESVSKSIDYLINNHNLHYEKDYSYGHGLIDRLHYLIQIEFYLSHMFSEYNLVSSDKALIIRELWMADCAWLIAHQCKDGGWHEIDKLRTRVGATSDAIRAINLDKEYLSVVELGVQFLINNQNPYEGYWDAGNLDKCLDAIKTLINSRQLLKDCSQLDRSVELGLSWILNNFDTVQQLEENIYDLLTVTIDYEKVFVNQTRLTYL